MHDKKSAATDRVTLFSSLNMSLMPYSPNEKRLMPSIRYDRY